MKFAHTIAVIGAAVVVLIPAVASAHPGIPGHMHGFVYGFAHPFSGIDHLLVMVAVGLFAAQVGGRALWLVPLSFVSVMSLAAIAGMSGIPLPLAQMGIALSVVALGLALAFQISMPASLGAALVAFFAIFHGYVHGAETSATMSGLSFALGFVCATALLHAIGIGLGWVGARTSGRAVRLGGAAMAVTGLALVFS